MTSQQDIKEEFERGETQLKAGNVEIRPTNTHGEERGGAVIVGYGHAIYAYRDPIGGEITYFGGWSGYSPTTSSQLSTLGLRPHRSYDREKRREGGHDRGNSVISDRVSPESPQRDYNDERLRELADEAVPWPWMARSDAEEERGLELLRSV